MARVISTGSTSIPQALQDFISRHFDSLALFEVLLVMYENRDRSLSVDEANHILKSSPSSVQEMLDKLVEKHLVRVERESAVKYRYNDQDSSRHELVSRAVELYPKFRLRFIELIYPPRTSALKNFADAFKIKKSGDNDG